MRNQDTQRIIYVGLFIAIVFVATYFIQIPTPGSMGGLVHVGTVALFAIALKYGKYYGALSGGIGMAIFDLLSAGYAYWAPGTFVVRLIMGYAVGRISEDKMGQGTNFMKNIIAIVIGALIMLSGYFVFQAYILSEGYGNAIGAIPGNLTQILFGLSALIIIKKLPELKTNGK